MVHQGQTNIDSLDIITWALCPKLLLKHMTAPQLLHKSADLAPRATEPAPQSSDLAPHATEAAPQSEDLLRSQLEIFTCQEDSSLHNESLIEHSALFY